ncbi:hypothetical protein HAX54_032577 [Datura stramonium]|uniref:Uncharacterized protein n=1 Tax=Datura stramonium TaxID=4076 RepID=A0ABS8VE78_DATST|nr:hypothetical protein [Datura stramonium]
MESYKSNVDNMTFNGTLDAANSSTPVHMPRDGSSSESRDGSIESYIQGVQATRQELGHSDSALVERTIEFLLENTPTIIFANTGSGERTTDVVNPNTQTIIPWAATNQLSLGPVN